MQNQQIVNESLQSKAQSDRSLAAEREMRGRLEQVEIQTKFNESEHQKAATMLDKAKAAKEIESMGVADFVSVLTLLDNIQKRKDEKETAVQNNGAKNGTQP